MSKRPGHRQSKPSKSKPKASKLEDQKRKRAEKRAREEAEFRKRSRAAKRGWKKRKAVRTDAAIQATKRTTKRKGFSKTPVPSTRAQLATENKRMKEKVRALEERQERLKKHIKTLHREMTEPEDIDKVWLKMGFRTKRMKEVLTTLRKMGKITFDRACYDIADDFGIEPREVFRWFFGY